MHVYDIVAAAAVIVLVGGGGGGGGVVVFVVVRSSSFVAQAKCCLHILGRKQRKCLVQGTFIAAGGYTRETGNRAIAEGKADLITFGVALIYALVKAIARPGYTIRLTLILKTGLSAVPSYHVLRFT
jgi:hypothetical protein